MKTKAWVAAIALVGLALSVEAANTATITVNATVQTKCSVTGSDNITFSIDPTTNVNAVGTGSGSAITYNCTKGFTPAATFGSANTGNSTSWFLKSVAVATDTMNYTPSLVSALTAGAGFGTGTSQPVQVRVSVAPADFQNAPAHADYGDTITLTIQ